MGGFESSTLQREVQFATRSVAPPSTLYINRDDKLVVTTSARAIPPIPRVIINARLLLPNGEIIPQRFVHTVTSIIFTEISTFDLAEGFLISAVASIENRSEHQGDLFITLHIGRGPFQVGEFALLARGYISEFEAVGWPAPVLPSSIFAHGSQLALSSADPPVGTEASISGGQAQYVRLYAATATLVTDATVASRRANLSVLGSALPVINYPVSVLQIASQTFVYVWGAGLAMFSDATVPARATAPIPNECLLHTFTIATLTDNLQAGDNWTALTIWLESWQHSF